MTDSELLFRPLQSGHNTEVAVLMDGCEAGFHSKIAKIYANLSQTPSGHDFLVQT